ncbi:MAG TPA: non-homologous end-joining DNA ligase [Steroidobacteraceae bacterium]|nr:non-homologous end-joining DNA ligase [Steroidobacteraceae bacterium]
MQLARLVDHAPEGADWLHEVKFDGYRVLIWRDGRKVRITSRGNQDWSAKLQDAAQAARKLTCRSCILDGEVVALDADGRSSFARLQQFFGAGASRSQLRIMVFDLLFLDGHDLRGLPQIERKQRLARLMRARHTPLELSAYTLGNGREAAETACRQHLEGIISKLTTAPYLEGRSGAWLKIKCVDSDEFAILAYTAGRGARERLGSLLLGSPGDHSRWRYRGRVGTGLNERSIAELLRRLHAAPQPPPLENPPTRAQLRGATPLWVRPELVVEVEFRGYTDDGLLRQASLKGLRYDRGVDSLKRAARDVAVITSDRR